MIRSVPQNIFDDVVGCRITSFMESLSECEVALDLVEGFSAVKYRNFNHFTIWHLFTVRNSWQTISSLSLQTKHLQVKSIFQKIAPFPGCIFLKWPHFKKNTLPFVWKTYPLLGLSDTWIRMSDTKKLRWILQLLVVSRQLSVILKIWSFWGGGEDLGYEKPVPTDCWISSNMSMLEEKRTFNIKYGKVSLPIGFQWNHDKLEEMWYIRIESIRLLGVNHPNILNACFLDIFRTCWRLWFTPIYI